jgi:putative transposase
MPRQVRLDAFGALQHVIFRGIEKGRIVEDEKDQENFVNRLGQLAQETGTRIFSWSLLTNHAHLLLKSGPEGLPNFMRRFLTGYLGLARQLARELGISSAEIARQLGVSTSAISKALSRNILCNST